MRDVHYYLIKLFIDKPIDKPFLLLRDYLSDREMVVDTDSTWLYDVAPSIFTEYGGKKLSDTVAFYCAHLMIVAQKKGIDATHLDFEQMKVCEFSIPKDGLKGILLAVPKR